MSNTAPKNNRLDQKKAYTLLRWIEANAESLTEKTLPEIVGLSSEGVGFPVSLSNLQTAKETLGIELGRPVRQRQKNENDAVIAAQLIEVCNRLGIVPDPELFVIASIPGAPSKPAA